MMVDIGSTGARPYACNQCEKTYGDPSILTRHKASAHKYTPYHTFQYVADIKVNMKKQQKWEAGSNVESGFGESESVSYFVITYIRIRWPDRRYVRGSCSTVPFEWNITGLKFLGQRRNH